MADEDPEKHNGASGLPLRKKSYGHLNETTTTAHKITTSKTTTTTQAAELGCKATVAPPPGGQHSLFSAAANGHHPHIDATRIACVWCVAIDHGAASFGIANVMFTQNWVLQYLFLVCGVSFGLSNKSMYSYVGRLGAYFVFGVLINVSANVMTAQNWVHHMFDVVFQFWFVAALMVYIVLLTPLKAHLLRVSAQLTPPAPQEDANPEITASPTTVPGEQSLNAWLLVKAVLVVVIGFLTISFIFVCIAEPLSEALSDHLTKLTKTTLGKTMTMWGMPATKDASHTFVVESLVCLQLTLTNLFVVLVYPYFSGETSLVGWLLLVITYSHRIVFFRGQQERPLHCLDLTMLGLVCYFYGLRNRQRVSRFLARYWMVVLFCCAMLWPPFEYANKKHRFDEEPIDRLDERARWNALEGILLMIWLVAGERLADPKIFTEDGFGFLNIWALLVFLLHKAIHITILAPLNWVFLLALAPLCKFMS